MRYRWDLRASRKDRPRPSGPHGMDSSPSRPRRRRHGPHRSQLGSRLDARGGGYAARGVQESVALRAGTPPRCAREGDLGGLRLPPALDRGPDSLRPSAHVRRGGAPLDRLQRRDLQLDRAEGGVGGVGRAVHQHERHRGDPCRLSTVGGRLPVALERDVRARDLGSDPPCALLRPRSSRRPPRWPRCGATTGPRSGSRSRTSGPRSRA